MCVCWFSINFISVFISLFVFISRRTTDLRTQTRKIYNPNSDLEFDFILIFMGSHTFFLEFGFLFFSDISLYFFIFPFWLFINQQRAASVSFVGIYLSMAFRGCFCFSALAHIFHISRTKFLFGNFTRTRTRSPLSNSHSLFSS